jgi:predicted CXXCH cytochrome family protein
MVGLFMIPGAQFPLRLMVTCLLAVAVSAAGDHPMQVDEKSNCLECHRDKTKGNHVHAAVKMGCTTCHSVSIKEGVTYVTLRQSGTCFTCHHQKTFRYTHFVYSPGMCTRCHDPHSAGNGMLLKARVNDLCLGCHLRSTEVPPSRYMPSIVLTENNTKGHPFIRHPVAGKIDPLTGDELSCVSCHTAHGGAKIHLLKMGREVPEDALNENTEMKDMCRKCHEVMWGLEGTDSRKKPRH